MRVALVHDWLLGMRGGERCLEVFCEIFPEADIYTLFYDKSAVTETISQHRIYESALRFIPFRKRFHRFLLLLYRFGMADLSRKLQKRSEEGAKEGKGAYDLVVSVSHCGAKNISVPPTTAHLCYCLTPMRYIWDQYERYFGGRPLERLVRAFRPSLQAWDVKGARGVDVFVGISEFVCSRIKHLYGRESSVIYPPVRTNWITPCSEGEEGEGFLCVNALVPYKNVDIVIEAFNELGLPLTVVGQGPEEKRLRAMACRNIKFITRYLPEGELSELYRGGRALVFAAEEDFGMIPVEVLAAGRPVIAWGKGGALETICQEGPLRSGVFFSELSSCSLAQAVRDFLEREDDFTVDACVRGGRNFSLERFQLEFARALHLLQEQFGASICMPQCLKDLTLNQEVKNAQKTRANI